MTGQTTAQFAAGEALFREGDPAGPLYVVRRGSVRLTRLLRGREVVLAELGDGDFAGEIGLGCDSQAATCTALGPTSCLIVEPAALEEMVAGDAEIGIRLIRGLAARLGALHEQLDLVGRPPTVRIALAIARAAERSGDADPEGLLVRRRLRDLGNDLGVGDSQLGEASTVLVRERLIRIKKNGILVPDPHRMYDYVQAADAREASEG